MIESNHEFDHLPDAGELASMLLDENDPRSTAYKRKIVRPQINWAKIGFVLFVPLAFLLLVILFAPKLGLSKEIAGMFAICFLLVYFSVFAKRAVIALIRVYQRFAPETIRNKCRFEPSCSEYMILAIEKYGLFKGVKSGIKRLKRCNVNGGGYDYP